MADFQTIGQRHIRVDALDKVTGKAMYAGDVYLPGMLMCKLLVSTHSHARIVRIDTSAAEELPGVKAVITGQKTHGLAGLGTHAVDIVSKDFGPTFCRSH